MRIRSCYTRKRKLHFESLGAFHLSVGLALWGLGLTSISKPSQRKLGESLTSCWPVIFWCLDKMQARKPALSQGPSLACGWRHTQDMFKYLKGRSQANRVLTKVFCSLSFDKSTFAWSKSPGSSLERGSAGRSYLWREAHP